MTVQAALRGVDTAGHPLVRRTAEGKTKPEILRCLRRYIARETYPLLTG